MSDNVRGQYWLEASGCIAKANDLHMGTGDWWALTLSALVNSNMASVPDSVMDEVEVLAIAAEAQAARALRKQRLVQQDIRKVLHEKV